MKINIANIINGFYIITAFIALFLTASVSPCFLSTVLAVTMLYAVLMLGYVNSSYLGKCILFYIEGKKLKYKIVDK